MIHERGLTLLEITVVLAIIAMIGIITAPKVFNSQFETRVVQFNARAESIIEALNVYYEHHCSNPAPPSPTISGLVSGGYIQPSEVVNPFGGQYSVAINWGAPTRLRVQAVTPPSLTLEQTGKANRRVANTVIWDTLPKIRTNIASAEVLAYKHIHEPEACR